MVKSLDKKSLRKHFSKLRREMDVETKRQADKAIFSKLTRHPKILEARVLCIYVSFREEVDTKRLIEWALGQGKQVVIPKVEDDVLILKKIDSLEECVPGFKGILEPPESAPEVQLLEIEVVVLQGLAFDKKGCRLGYGKGYTDKLLSQDKPYTIGVGYAFQLVDALPVEPHDVPIEEVITQ
jgi:5-formyltetrahydrofolate cyclo-ligase